MLLHLRIGAMASDPCHIEPDGGQCAADIVMDLAGNGRTFLFDRGLQMFRQVSQSALRGFQLRDSQFARLTGFMNLQGACNDMRQPLKVVFKQVIGNAQADRIYSCCLADGSRQKDKGGVAAFAPHVPTRPMP